MSKYTSFFLLITLIFINCKLRVSTEPTEKIIDEIREEFAPDKRVANWRIWTSAKGQTIVLKGETNLPEAKRALLDKLRKSEIQYEDNINILPDSKLEGKVWGIVRLSVCNIRSKDKHSAELSTQAVMGTPLRVLKKREDKDWYYIQTPDNYLGWLDADGLELMTEEEYNSWKSAEKVVVQKSQTVAYSNPNSESSVISDLILGNILKKNNESGDFIEIGFPDGRIGFINKNDQIPYENWLNRDNPTGENILATAQQFMGHPYLWGGTSAKGFDCSGFTKTVFYWNGIQIARDASQQVHTGNEIETDSTWKNLLPGDLLFFGQKAKGRDKERIRHVAIYLGDGKIIHSAGNVKIESLVRGEPDFAEDRLNTFIRAKRMLNSLNENGVDLLTNLELYQPNPS